MLKLRSGRSEASDRVRRSFGGSLLLERPLFSWELLRDIKGSDAMKLKVSSRNLSKSLSFTQFAADSVEHLPSKRGQGEGSQGWQCDRTNARLMCAQLSCPQTWQDTKLYSSSHIMPMPLCKQKKNNFVDVLPFLKNPREALVYMKFLQSKR